jgi:hypothetical protein
METPLEEELRVPPAGPMCANTHKCLAMRLRTGSADLNTVADHLKVLANALVQVPGASTAKTNTGPHDGALAQHSPSLPPRRKSGSFAAVQGGHLPCVPTLVLQTARSYWK